MGTRIVCLCFVEGREAGDWIGADEDVEHAAPRH